MFHEDWIEDAHINEWAVFERAKFFEKKPNKAWKTLESLLLLKAISLLDLTTLGGDDCFSNVTALVNKGVRPLPSSIFRKTFEAVVSLIENISKLNLQRASNSNIEVDETGIKINTNKNININDDMKLPYEELLEVKQMLQDFGLLEGNIEDNVSKFLSLKNEITDCRNETRKTIRVGAICVYPALVQIVADSLLEKNLHLTNQQAGAEEDRNNRNIQNDVFSGMPIASVAAGFPSGLYGLESKIKEINYAINSGASEIDIVVSRHLVLGQRWFELFNEVKALKEACGSAKMKTILAVGECGSLENVYKASLVVMMAGSDFIKTSTGKEAINATFPTGIVMSRAIKNYFMKTSKKVGFKPAGGIRTAEDSLKWIKLIYLELGPEWLSLFRIGASGVLKNIENRLKELNP